MAYTNITIDTSSSGTTQLIAAVSGHTFTINEVYIIATSGVRVSFLDGSTNISGSIPLTGGTQGAFYLPHTPEGHWATTTANTAFNLSLDTAVRVTGYLRYTQN